MIDRINKCLEKLKEKHPYICYTYDGTNHMFVQGKKIIKINDKILFDSSLDSLEERIFNSDTFKEDNFIKKSECSSKVETEKNNQIGGTHYQMPIQPIEYIVKNKLGFREGNIIKYVTRYPYKNGLEDLLKAQDYLNMLIKEEKEKIN